MTGLNLTFGIELEFICVYPRGLFRDILGVNAEQNAGNYIYRFLRHKGIPATGHEDDDEIFASALPTYSSWRVEDDDLHLSPGEKALLPPGHEVEAIELSSRKFTFAQHDWRETNGEIAVVLSVVEELKKLGCLVIANHSTGFHVHVGNGEENFPLRTVKNLCKVVTIFERGFDELHNTHRLMTPDSYSSGDYSRCYAPPSLFYLNDPFWGKSYERLSERLRAIQAAHSYEGLCKLFSCAVPPEANIATVEGRTHGKYSAYNFNNLFPNDEIGRYQETLTRTIEFRQHAVRFSHGATDAGMHELHRRADEPAMQRANFLYVIGCKPDLMKFYQVKNSPDTYERYRTFHAGLFDRLHRGEFQGLEALRAQNKVEQFARSNKLAVQALVKQKESMGCYGIAYARTPEEQQAVAGLMMLSQAGTSQQNPLWLD